MKTILIFSILLFQQIDFLRGQELLCPIGAIEKMPQYNCLDSNYMEDSFFCLKELIRSEMKYSKSLRCHSGIIVVSFLVSENGDLSDFIVHRDFGGTLSNQLISILKTTGPWKPGISQGKKVPLRVNFPFRIGLE